MSNTVRAVIKDGKIAPIEPIDLPEGTKLLITTLSDDDDFWREVGQESLKRIWDNPEDDIYAQLLDK